MSLLLSATFLPFIAAILILLLPRRWAREIGIGTVVLSAVIFSLVVAIQVQGVHGEGLSVDLPWGGPGLDLRLALRHDGLAGLFALIISGIGVLIALYANYYLGPDEDRRNFYSYFLLFMGSMLGVVFSDHLLLLFVFWELTSLSSFLLIGFWFEREASRYGATKALLVTGMGGLVMLAGFILLGIAAGTWSVHEVLERGASIRNHPYATVSFLLIFVGCATKSAQFPFHIWLPNAMEAPTPVSAYLHSATMVKAGLFLAARLRPVYGELDLWFPVVGGIGFLSMAAGGILALRQTDLKALLAYSTISQLGMIMTALGIPTEVGGEAAVAHVLNHAAFKAALFMVVGIVDHECGSRDLSVVSGVRKWLPRTFVVAAVACWSMAGLAPLGGFISKELFFESSLHLDAWPGWLAHSLPFLLVAASVFTFAYTWKFLFWTFLGKPSEKLDKHPHKPPLGMLVSPAILAGMTILLGLLPNLLVPGLLEPAAHAANFGVLHGETEAHMHLGLWHGFGPALVMSLVVIIAGLLAGFRLRPIVGWQTRVAERYPKFRINTIYDGMLDNATAAGRWVSLRIQTGRLQHYLVVIFLFAILLVTGGALAAGWRFEGSLDWSTVREAPYPNALTTLVILLAAFGTAWFRNRIVAILFLGVTGYLVAYMYELMRAPDLALTQYLIETVSVILFLLVFWFMPPLKCEKPGGRKLVFDLSVAGLVGVFFFGVMLTAMQSHDLPSIAPYYNWHSKDLAGGNNIVNVIIVDFRGFDTMWEITVLALAAISIFALIRRRNLKTH
jgi:multicomponent Na+:H+ antiporter subunit A